jgi:uncharacterized protein YjdB
MKQKYVLLILLIIILSTTSISVLAVTPNIELTPPTQSVNQGTQATIEVIVEDVTDLKGANIILNFDATKLQYASSADGGFIPGALLAPPTVDNINGLVTLDIASIISHASGTGTIISVTFETIGAGDGSITFGTTTLRDKDNLIIDHIIGSGCLVTVNAELTEITVLPETMTLFVGEDSTVTSITASYNYGPDKTIALSDCSYDSEDESIATVAIGVITAVEAGPATITITYSEGGITKTDTVVVTVNAIVLTEIVVLPETMNLLKGDSETITSVTAHYNNGDTAIITLADCTYSSDDESIATVAIGVITAVEAGTAIITLNYTKGGITKTDTVVVTVNAKLTEITVLPETMTLFVGEDRTITSITASYNYGPDKTIALADCSYNSDTTAVATVSTSGKITAMDVGTATVTVTYIEEGITKTDTLGVTVNPIQLTSIVVLPETMTLFKGNSETITSIIAHYNNGDITSITLANCTYNSDTTAVATVSTSGEITAMNVGTAIITVTYSEGEITKTAITEITVIPVPNLKLTPHSQSVNQGTQVTIDIEVEDVINLKGASITLNFDASKLQYSSSVAGGFIPGAFLTPPTVDNTKGTVILNLASLTSYVSGTGTIVTATFNTIEAGDITITFGTTTLRNKDNYDINHTAGIGCMVTVNPIQLTSIVVLPETMALFEGGETDSIASITAHYNNEDTAAIALGDCTYNSDDESVATVAVGVVTTVDPGTATITVTYIEGGITKTDTLEVTVNPIQLTSIVVLPETMTLFKGNSETITSVTAHYNNGDTTSITLANCTYNSDTTAVATISASGEITAMDVGTATITVTYSEGGITKTDITEITVIPVPNLKLTPLSQSVGVNDFGTVDVIVEDATDLRGANISLNFDASKLQYSSSNNGDFIPNDTLQVISIDNTNGSVTLDIAGLDTSGYHIGTGTGTIIIVVFERIATSNTNITFETTQLRDKDNNTINHTTGSGCLFTNLLGDFGSANNGPPDCKVDFEDLMIFALAYGSTPSDGNWNPVCDITGPDGPAPDGVIDFEDLMVFAMHYGETCADL